MKKKVNVFEVLNKTLKQAPQGAVDLSQTNVWEQSARALTMPYSSGLDAWMKLMGAFSVFFGLPLGTRISPQIQGLGMLIYYLLVYGTDLDEQLAEATLFREEEVEVETDD
jgi:hypothetical protein